MLGWAHLWVFMSKNSTLEDVLARAASQPPDTTTPGRPFSVSGVQPCEVRPWRIGGTLHQSELRVGRARTNQRSPEPAVGGELQLHGGHLLAAAAEHEHGAAAGDGVAGDDAAVVPRGAGEAPLRHVLPAHARPPGVEYLGIGFLRINKGICKS